MPEDIATPSPIENDHPLEHSNEDIHRVNSMFDAQPAAEATPVSVPNHVLEAGVKPHSELADHHSVASTLAETNTEVHGHTTPVIPSEHIPASLDQTENPQQDASPVLQPKPTLVSRVTRGLRKMTKAFLNNTKHEVRSLSGSRNADIYEGDMEHIQEIQKHRKEELASVTH